MSNELDQIAFIDSLWEHVQAMRFPDLIPAESPCHGMTSFDAYMAIAGMTGKRRGALKWDIERMERELAPEATMPRDEDLVEVLTPHELEAHELRMNDLRYGNDPEAVWGPGAFFTPGPRGEMMVTVP